MNNLHQIFKKYGGLSLKFRQKCIGLLPAIYKQKIHEHHKMSIFEYAAKFAGISHEQVRIVLRLDKKFEDKPVLKKLLTSGEVSVNKLARITSVATPENEEFWANQVKLLPNRALETLVRDENTSESKNENGLQKGLFEEKSLHVQTFGNLKLDDDVIQKLQELQHKGIDINQIIREALQNREAEITAEKEQILAEVKGGGLAKPSRYIPIKIRKIIQKEQGTKCSIPTCSKPAINLHHTQRYALTHNHNPYYLAQLCKDHHTIAHHIDVKCVELRRLNSNTRANAMTP